MKIKILLLFACILNSSNGLYCKTTCWLNNTKDFQQFTIQTTGREKADDIQILVPDKNHISCNLVNTKDNKTINYACIQEPEPYFDIEFDLTDIIIFYAVLFSLPLCLHFFFKYSGKTSSSSLQSISTMHVKLCFPTFYSICFFIVIVLLLIDWLIFQLIKIGYVF